MSEIASYTAYNHRNYRYSTEHIQFLLVILTIYCNYVSITSIFSEIGLKSLIFTAHL